MRTSLRGISLQPPPGGTYVRAFTIDSPNSVYLFHSALSSCLTGRSPHAAVQANNFLTHALSASTAQIQFPTSAADTSPLLPAHHPHFSAPSFVLPASFLPACLSPDRLIASSARVFRLASSAGVSLSACLPVCPPACLPYQGPPPIRRPHGADGYHRGSRVPGGFERPMALCGVCAAPEPNPGVGSA